MDKLWAPWRINYIKTCHKVKGCIFCNFLRQKNDKKNLVLLRSKHSVCLLNKYPYNNGHLLICPKKHVKELGLLSNEELLDIMSLLNNCQSLLQKTLNPDGFNIGMNLGPAAGAGIPDHVHMHMVPRWNEDTNFMPVLFDTKIISQSLEELYAQLHRNIRK